MGDDFQRGLVTFAQKFQSFSTLQPVKPVPYVRTYFTYVKLDKASSLYEERLRVSQCLHDVISDRYNSVRTFAGQTHSR